MKPTILIAALIAAILSACTPLTPTPADHTDDPARTVELPTPDRGNSCDAHGVVRAAGNGKAFEGCEYFHDAPCVRAWVPVEEVVYD